MMENHSQRFQKSLVDPQSSVQYKRCYATFACCLLFSRDRRNIIKKVKQEPRNHAIKLAQSTEAPRRAPAPLLSKVKEEIEKIISKGIILKVVPNSFPIYLIKLSQISKTCECSY
ncbi:hypothetical protein ILUMI_02172 [Ignelater luminosus]|uniref:Uncharacterized protein n=1 Tax=Ignelater luminosus TaxID=2038154 RepID=A0A8K0DGX2_IGNLU|nr:hypothetical protein ILUMI_02172 [Ignelater luminosus]